MRCRALSHVIMLSLLASLLVFAASEGVSVFTSKRAKEAEKTYTKAMERIKADYDTKAAKARAEYVKALESALKEIKKAKDSAAEVERITKTIEDLKREGTSPAKRQPPKAPEKIGEYTYTGGNGESFEQAVVIGGAEDSFGAVDAEGVWLKKHYPNFRKGGQSLAGHEGKKFDIIEIEGPGGKKKIYFDITACFGLPKEFPK